jgi:putative DNA primase/helicase
MSALSDLGIHLRHERDGTHRIACPQCPKGKSQALSVRIRGDEFTFRCFRCEWSGTSQGDVTEGAAADVKPQRPADPGRMLELWRNGRPIEPGTAAASYLEARACALPHSDGDLRWHPALRHPCGFVGPVLLALMTDAVTGDPLTLHRTWIQPDGRKADVDPPRLYWKGLTSGRGVVRLWPDAEVSLGLCVAEGLETALSAAAGFGLAWACLDAWHLRTLPVLPGIDALTIVADHDKRNPQTGIRPGNAAANACARRWAAAGVEVLLWTAPAEGQDFNDIARVAS